MNLTLPDQFRRIAGPILLLASLASLVALVVPLMRHSLTPKERMSILYNVPMYGMFFLWLFCRIRENAVFLPLQVLLDGLVVGIAASRFLGPYLPASGHALFLSYSLLTVASYPFRIASGVLLALTIMLKLSWGDYYSWTCGLLLGVPCAIFYGRLSRRNTSNQD